LLHAPERKEIQWRVIDVALQVLEETGWALCELKKPYVKTLIDESDLRRS
jgi:hypothetical protein